MACFGYYSGSVHYALLGMLTCVMYGMVVKMPLRLLVAFRLFVIAATVAVHLQHWSNSWGMGTALPLPSSLKIYHLPECMTTLKYAHDAWRKYTHGAWRIWRLVHICVRCSVSKVRQLANSQ
jgi:hypothetical protein